MSESSSGRDPVQNAPSFEIPMTAQDQLGAPAPEATHPHDFEAQKEVHRQIRNDPDYDDWEYGTEPLPQEPETWINPKTAS
jgi:hypothetical protein